MSKTRSIIDQALKATESAVLDRYQGRELEFFRERGRTYPEKLEEVFNAILHPTHDDLVIIGPRGGGKTMGVYDACTARFLWFEDDVFGVGGSEQQAINGFRYMRQIVYQDSTLGESMQDSNKSQATGPNGNWFRITAASQKGVRGPHPGDPHPEMGWVSHGGVLIKDERDEMDDEIADAADFCMDSASPSLIVTTSTMHRADGGGIAKMAAEAEARGARVIKFDILDVNKRCEHDCAACPGKHAFAGALYGGNTVKGRTQATAETRDAWDKWKKDNAFPVDEEAYCRGRAKEHRDGHVEMDKIFRAFRRSRHREIFEVELMCRSRKGARKVLDGAALDRCLHPATAFMSGYDAPIITIDWGFKGWAVLCAVQGQQDHAVAVIDCRYEHMTSTDGLIAICEQWRDAYGCFEVYADSSHPFQNFDLVNAGFDVTEVVFGTSKEMGAGWLKGIVERGQLRLPGELVPANGSQVATRTFISSDVEELFNQLVKWQRDDKGKIVKKDDHGPDSLSCAAQKFAGEPDVNPVGYGTGRRNSFTMGVGQ